MPTEDPGFRAACPGSEAPERGYQGPGCVLSRDKSDESDQTDRWWDLAHPRLLRWDKKYRYGSCPSLVLLSWWYPPLARRGGTISVWSTWFPNSLPLERTRLYLDLLGCNRQPTVSGVHDTDKNDLSHSYDIHFKSHFHCCVLRDEMNKTRLHLHMFWRIFKPT
jgi:hypothetical protein